MLRWFVAATVTLIFALIAYDIAAFRDYHPVFVKTHDIPVKFASGS